MDPQYLYYTFGNIYRNTYVIELKSSKGWMTLRCIQREYGSNCVIDGIKGAQINTFTFDNAERIKARYNKNNNIYIGYDKKYVTSLRSSEQIIIGFN
jgi:hypothetical protein